MATIHAVIYTDGNGSINSAHATPEDAWAAAAEFARQRLAECTGESHEHLTDEDAIDAIRMDEDMTIEVEEIDVPSDLIAALYRPGPDGSGIATI